MLHRVAARAARNVAEGRGPDAAVELVRLCVGKVLCLALGALHAPGTLRARGKIERGRQGLRPSDRA
jgi:hypothetical protein